MTVSSLTGGNNCNRVSYKYDLDRKSPHISM